MYLHFSQYGKLKSWNEYHQEAAKKECWEVKTLIQFVIRPLRITGANVDEITLELQPNYAEIVLMAFNR